MKMNLSKFNPLYSGKNLDHARFKPTAVALAFMSVGSALLPSQSVQAEGENVIEEVLITARKREESLQEVPVAVNVLTGDMINSQRIEGIKDLGTIVPGLVTSRAVASTTGAIYLRGVGTGTLNPMFDQAVAVNLDGVGTSSTQLMNAGMFDLERIEVLRGPQALFYGKNSPGGVIAVHTKDPTDEYEFELSGMYETEGEESSLRAIVSGPLTDTLGARLSIGGSQADNALLMDVYNMDVVETGPTGDPVQTVFGTDKNPTERENFFAMGTLVWKPTDNLSAKLKYAHLEDDLEGDPNLGYQRTQCPFGTPQVVYPVPGVNNCKMDGKVMGGGIDPSQVAGDVVFGNLRDEGFQKMDTDFAVFEINYEMDNDLTLTSVTGYFDNHEDRFVGSGFQVAAGLYSAVKFDLEQWSQEIRLNSNYDGPVNFTAGAFYEEKEMYQEYGLTIGSAILGIPASALGVFPIAAGRQFSEQDSTAYSVFAQVDWDFADNWTLSAGARYSYEEKEGAFAVDYFADYVAAGLEDGGPDTDVPLLDDKPDWHNVSPELTLRYQYSEDVMFFASYKTSFKSGGFDAGYKAAALRTQANSGIPYNNVYDEEEVSGFEVGMKSTLLDGTLRFNVTAYNFDYEDMQLNKYDAVTGQGVAVRVINAAEASLQGVELETFWVTPVDGLSLTANVAWSNAEYDDYIADCYNGQTIALGCDITPDPVTGRFTESDLSGDPLTVAPDLNATFGVDYTVALGGNWNLGVNVTTSYKDDYNPSSQSFPKSWWQDSFWWTNASLSLSSADNKWEFYVRGENLGDEFYSNTGSHMPFSGDEDLTGTNDPSGLPDFLQYVEGGRQFTLGFTYRM